MRKFLFLTLLFFCAPALAATTITRHVDKDCATNGDGTVASPCASGGAGSTGPYNSWSNAEADINSDYANFVSSDVVVSVQLHAGADDTSEVFVDGSTMDATRYLEFICDAGYVLTVSGADSVRLSDTNVRIQGCTIKNTSGNSVIKLENGIAGGEVYVIGNKLVDGGDAVSGNNFGNNTKVVIAKNFLYSQSGAAINISNSGSSGQTHIVYNNTCYAEASGDTCYQWITYGGTDTGYWKNNVANNCTAGACWYTESGYSTYGTAGNITSDSDSPEAGGRNTNCTFVDSATGDLHLASGDTACKDFGSDLSGDSAYAFSTDIDGDTMGTWPAGADEIVASTPGFSVLEAIGGL